VELLIKFPYICINYLRKNNMENDIQKESIKASVFTKKAAIVGAGVGLASAFLFLDRKNVANYYGLLAAGYVLGNVYADFYNYRKLEKLI